MPSSIAPFVAAFRRRLVNLPGPVRASGEASNGEPVVVELLVGGEWVDLTADGYVMVRDDSGHIKITYGIQGGEGSQTDRATATLQLRNTDGRFSPRNPTGPYYDTLNWRSAQIRVSVPDGNGGKSYRIWGKVSEWAPDSDRSGNDVWVDVTVNGILQQLAQGPAPERSVVFQAVTDPLSSSVVAYWPCEDASGATRLSSALTSGSEMTWTGTLALASYDGFAASDPLPDLTSAVLSGGVARYDEPTATQVRFLARIPPDGLADGKVLASIDQADFGGNQFWELYYSTTTRSLVLRQCQIDGALLGVELSHDLDVRGRLLYVSVELEESGASVNRAVRLKDVNTGTVYSVTDTAAATALSRVTKVEFGRASRSAVGPFGTQYLPGVAIGHVTVEDMVTAIDALGTRLNPIGERAGRRIERLCGEESIALDWVGDLDDTVPLGAQGRQNTLSLIQESVLADGGLLYENRQVLGLGYRTRASLQSQDPALTLSYPGFNLAEVPVPVDDDRQTQNILTVTVGGVSGTYEETDGVLGTEAIGKYGESAGLTLNLASSDAATLRDHAAWRVHLGTVDEDRFPKISVNLAHSSITPAMKRAILALRLGDRVQITSPPSWMAPDTIDQLVLGLEETITHFEHRLTFICAPSSPYNTIGSLDAISARIDTDGSVLVSEVSSSGTSLVVAPSAGEETLWTTDTADMPFDVRVGGEVMRVTAVADWLSDTFTRVAASSWGTADSGQAWSVSGGSASDYSVSGTVGVHTLTTVTTTRRSFISTSILDFDYYGDLTTSATATGGSLFGGLAGRYIDSSNTYYARLEFDVSNVVTLTFRKIVAGVENVLGTYVVPITHAPGTYVRVRYQARGSTLKAKAWLATALEPPEWHITAVDSAISDTDFFGTRSVASSANTNINPEIQYDNLHITSPQTLTVTRSINGVVKAHNAGADIRLANPTILAL